MRKNWLILSLFFLVIGTQLVKGQQFQCPPCGCSSDSELFEKAGTCPSCSMPLVNQENPSDGYAFVNIYPQDLCDDDKQYILLDVRTGGEFNGRLGHLKGAINIHVDDLQENLGHLEEFKDQPILVYCLVSIRSVRASQLLVDNGFSDVTNLLGGMDMWNDLSIEKLPCKEEKLVRN